MISNSRIRLAILEALTANHVSRIAPGGHLVARTHMQAGTSPSAIPYKYPSCLARCRRGVLALGFCVWTLSSKTCPCKEGSVPPSPPCPPPFAHARMHHRPHASADA
eukprot:scaffold2298_cov146-Isochrysis_galbana.AAC.3